MRKVLVGIALIGAVGVIALLAWGMAIQAQAARQTALAMTLSTAGHTTSSVGSVLWAGLTVLVLIAGGGACGYLWLRWKLAERRLARVRRPSCMWEPGPNAHRGREPELPGSNIESLLEKLVQVELLRALRELRPVQSLPLPDERPWSEAPEENPDGYWGWE